MELDFRIRLSQGMTGVILAALVLPALSAQEKTATKQQSLVAVPFVGCPSDGQVGPMETPKGTSKLVAISRQDAQRLAYYSAFRRGVLAPRGWHCFGVYGSGGSALFVVPQIVDTEHILSIDRDLSGPVIALSDDYGGTSGRDQVARVIARVFPAYRAFVDDLERLPGLEYETGPYPKDQLT